MTESVKDKPTILVVDDSRLMRVAARKILKEDFNILEAEDGEIAWEVLHGSERVDLIMSDLSMPNLDGLGLLKKIRDSRSQLSDLPVIIVTGAEDDDGSKKTALSAGASDFITKPFESVQLLARAKAQAQHQRTRQALKDSETSKQQLEKQSSVDPLTGLPNQRAFHSAIEESLSYAIRHRTELTVLQVQIDKYKIMFLRRGKQTAEEIVRRVAQLLSEGRRREDAVARIGMDTFGVLLPSANSVGAKPVAEQLQSAVADEDFGIDGDTVPVSVSIAVSSPLIQPGTTPDELLADGGQKLSAAQKVGGNRIQYALEASSVPANEPPEPVSEPEPTIPGALVADVQRALQALTDTAEGDCSADQLAKTVLPLLAAWNQAHANNHGSLIEQFRSALSVNENEASATEASPNSTAGLI
jgi:two-component system cell cycle response regulator